MPTISSQVIITERRAPTCSEGERNMIRRSLSLAPLALVLFLASAHGPDVEVFFNTPAITGSTGNVLQAGRIQKINLKTGGAPTVVVDGLAYPSGLGLDSAGNLYFGNVTFGPVRI